MGPQRPLISLKLGRYLDFWLEFELEVVVEVEHEFVGFDVERSPVQGGCIFAPLKRAFSEKPELETVPI